MGRLLQSHANGPRADVKRPITLASGFSDSEKRKKLGEALDFCGTILAGRVDIPTDGRKGQEREKECNSASKKLVLFIHSTEQNVV